ncbi:hypothetical protein ACTOVN_05515 [Arcanobacterium canis]
MKLNDQQINDLVNDFEAGWSDERLDRAQFTWEANAIQLLPAHLEKALRSRAEKEGTSELSVMREAIEAYLQSA